MPKAILHTEIHREMDSPLPPEEVALRLQRLPFAIQVGDYTGDLLPFHYQGNEIYLEGVVQRWQGTESHIEIVGKVTVPEISDRVRRIAAWLLFIGLVVVTVFTYPIAIEKIGQSEGICISQAAFCPDNTFSVWSVPALFVGLWIVVSFVIWLISEFDPFGRRRWVAQQDMGRAIEQIFHAVTPYPSK